MIEIRSITSRAAMAGSGFALLLAWQCYRPDLDRAAALRQLNQELPAVEHELIDDVMAAGPTHPLRAMKWRRDVRGLQNYVDEVESVQQ